MINLFRRSITFLTSQVIKDANLTQAFLKNLAINACHFRPKNMINLFRRSIIFFTSMVKRDANLPGLMAKLCIAFFTSIAIRNARLKQVFLKNFAMNFISRLLISPIPPDIRPIQGIKYTEDGQRK
jgi:hypothetical protein